MKTLLLSLMALLLTAGSCKKDDPEASLPPVTQEGKNTAGALLNGQAFIAKSYGGGILSAPIPAMAGGFSFDKQYCLFINGQVDGKGVQIMLFLNGERPTTYLLNQDTEYYPQGSPRFVLNHATYSTSGNSREVYGTDAKHMGRVTITKADVQKGLSAGTFEFTAVSNQDPTKVIIITNGRFDRNDF